jgi:hypothetical protein
MSDEHVLIMGGTDREVRDFARRNQLDPVLSISQPYQMRGRRGQRLIVLQDIYTRAPRWYELIAYAREAGLVIEYRNFADGAS